MRIALFALAWLTACPATKATDLPKLQDPTALRIAVAQHEARRGDGLAALMVLATGKDKTARLLALRGLGRVGGATALATLGDALGDSDAEVSGVAASAIGIATSLDEDTAGTPALTQRLLAVHAKRPADTQVIEAIGRAADTSAQGVLATGLGGSPMTAETSAIALGRFGRRKLELTAPTRTALVAALRHADPRVRYAAAHAFAREQLPKAATLPKTIGDALAALLVDGADVVRAQAAQALARRKLVDAYRLPLTTALYDKDWRVAVEAMRALGGSADRANRHQAMFGLMYWLWSIDGGKVGERWTTSVSDALMRVGKDEIEQFLMTEKERITAAPHSVMPGPSDASGAHVVIEGLRVLVPKSEDRMLAAMASLIASRASTSKTLPELTRNWIACLARSAAARATADLGAVATQCKLPDHLRLGLVGELIVAKVGSVEARRVALQPLLDHRDPRVRVSGMSSLAAIWDEGGEADHEAAVAMTIAALGHKDGLVAGTAIETAETLYQGIDKAKATTLRDRLDAALLARARTETDAELATALFGLIGKRTLAAGATACRAGVAGAPVLARAAVDCLEALGQPVELPPIAGAAPPPVDVTQVIGRQVTWKLTTTRGEIMLELRPDIAPWAVATIVTLTNTRFYDGLELHRVVPNFVAQGGDPTQSGWGGPGFTMPAEPSAGVGYVEGGVGMADAGRDSAGSQWFVMHAPAPHLDGRYTWIGRVVSGQSAANSLLIGDRVVRATVELSPRL